MKRLLFLSLIAILALASIVLAQTTTQATLRTSSGDKPVAVLFQNGQTYVSATDVVTTIGGTIVPDSNGFKITYNNVVAAFGSDSRFGVVRDDLIEMPANPIAIDGKPFVPWQFFHGLLSKVSSMEAVWDPAARVLSIRPQQKSVVGVQMSVANIQGISKIVLTLTSPAEYGIVKQQGAYTILFRSPIHAPFAEQSFEDPYIQKATFTGSELRIQLTGPDVAGDAYKLENPFRIILDLRKGAPGGTVSAPPAGSSKPVDIPGIHTIVIDPGHGGKDVGATGPGGMMEKDATLALCRKLAASLGSKLGARIVLTREDDTLIPLDQRTAIANQYKADLFLSVHMNAAVTKGAHGSETYFLSADASDELSRKAAEIENAAAKSAPQPAASDLKMMLWDLAQQDYVKESSLFAQTIQEEMNGATGVLSRGVKQAPFRVLVGATMPAALVEVAFISNPEEEAKLQKDEFQARVVDALTNAVQRYKTQYETRNGITPPASAPAPPAPAKSTAVPVAPPPALSQTRTGTQ